MAELADALDSGSSDRKVMQVQLLLSAPVRVFIIALGFFFFNIYCRISFFFAYESIAKQHYKYYILPLSFTNLLNQLYSAKKGDLQSMQKINLKH